MVGLLEADFAVVLIVLLEDWKSSLLAVEDFLIGRRSQCGGVQDLFNISRIRKQDPPPHVPD